MPAESHPDHGREGPCVPAEILGAGNARLPGGRNTARRRAPTTWRSPSISPRLVPGAARRRPAAASRHPPAGRPNSGRGGCRPRLSPREKKKAKKAKKKKGDVPTSAKPPMSSPASTAVLTKASERRAGGAEGAVAAALHPALLAGKDGRRVDAGLIQEYRVQPPPSAPPDPTILRGPRGVKFARSGGPSNCRRAAPSTKRSSSSGRLLKTANRKRWIAAVPDLSAPYKSRARLATGPGSRPRTTSAFTRDPGAGPQSPEGAVAYECEQFHDWVLFMANTGLRPDEASNLQYRDVSIILDEAPTSGSCRSKSGQTRVGY